MAKSIHTFEMQALRDWLIAKRKEQNLSMRALAERMDLPHSYVQKVEDGERRLDLVEFVWYCRALGIDPVTGAAEVISLIDSAH